MRSSIWITGAAFFGFALTAHAADAPQAVTGAMLRGLDKTTSRVTDLSVAVGTTVHFGTLDITLKDCRQNPPEEAPENAAFLDIAETKFGEKAQHHLFSGWMFSSSPAVSALEHPIYDIWVVDCMTAKTSAKKPG